MPRSSDGHRQVIVMGAQIDLELLKVEANTHHKAIDCIRGPNGMTRGRLGWCECNTGSCAESVPEATV